MSVSNQLKDMDFEIFGTSVRIDESYLASSKKQVEKELEEYRNGDRTSFSLDIKYPDGFLGEVMKAMERIPYGETRTYSEIAEEIGSAPIAVGQACGRNPVPLIVPCHRIVGKNSIGGYQYPGLKQKLLDLEK